MELITGIDWREGKTVALATVCWNKTSDVELSELASRGLPDSDALLRRYILDLRKFRCASFEEYAFVFNRPTLEKYRHSTWSVLCGRTRLVIPALALLRAFIRPGQVLFPKLFKPQSLDDVCEFSKNDNEYFVQSLIRLGDIRNTHNKTFMGPLSWFYCFPSARRAWASVYQSAKKGRLHFELPKATMTVSLRGMRVGATIYVTQLGLIGIEAHEDPLEFAMGHSLFIEASPTRSKAYMRNAQDEPVAIEFQELSDAEWDSIGPLLIRENRVPHIDYRPLLNCVLQKLSTTVSWQTAAELNNVTVTQAATVLSRWQADKRLDRVVERLSEIRYGVV
jgi:hypothetical protein